MYFIDYKTLIFLNVTPSTGVTFLTFAETN